MNEEEKEFEKLKKFINIVKIKYFIVLQYYNKDINKKKINFGIKVAQSVPKYYFININ